MDSLRKSSLTNKEQNHKLDILTDVIDEKTFLNEHPDIENVINTTCNEIDGIVRDIFLDSAFESAVLVDFYSDNYNKMTPKQRKDLFSAMNSLVSEYLTDGQIINKEITFTNYPYKDNRIIVIEHGEVYVYADTLKTKNIGVTLLINYIKELRKYLMHNTVNYGFSVGVDRDKLKGFSRIYYDNILESMLFNSWTNHLKREHKDYAYQPLIADSNIVAMQIGKEYMKFLYNKFKTIDKELSSLAYEQMEFENNLEDLKENRKRMIKQNQDNIMNSAKEEEDFQRYLKITAGNLSKLSDQEFYELFNSSYMYALGEDFDGKLVKRLTSLSNEVIHRTFKDIPHYMKDMMKVSFAYTDNELLVTIKVDKQEDNYLVDTPRALFSLVGTHIGFAAQHFNLFKFKDEEEEKDYFLMKEWVEETRDKEDEIVKKLKRNEMNIILIKTKELFYDLCKKIDDSIKASSFYPHGQSLIFFSDKQGEDDFAEFKNGVSNEVTYKKVMSELREDLKKRRMGRN